MKGRNILRVTVVAIALAWVGWNYSGRTHQAKRHEVAPASAASVAAAPTRTWTLGSVTFHSCMAGGSVHGGQGASVRAWCATYEVPENRARPDARRIGLHMVMVRATSQKPARDIVVLLAGGPGEAASKAVHVARDFPELARHHDFLLMDQRGTGKSHPLSCGTGGKPAAGPDDAHRIHQQVAECLARVRKHADPRFYTTTAAVADLEAVRQALGAPRFDLLGVSYGTRVAQQYLMRHPGGVRSVILDSPVPNTVALGQNMARNLQQALVKDFAQCTDRPACRKKFDDPMQSLNLLVNALAANPHKVGTRDPVSFRPGQQMLNRHTLASVVRFFAYSRAGITLLPLTIDAAAHGDVGPLLGQYALLHGNSDLAPHAVKGMNWSVICSEDADLLKSRPADADTLLGNQVVKQYQAICSVWPHGKRPADFHAPLHSDKPVLILSGALDPVTPPSYGKKILKGLSDARQLIIPGQGHGVEGVGCVPHLMARFVQTLQPEKLDAGCLKKQGPVIPFTSFNGATP